MITVTSDITVHLMQHVGSDDAIAAAARVDPDWTNPKRTELIRYLMQHKHGSPFEHSSMTFRVHAPIFVWREWHRHRVGWSYNEESARYKQLDPVFWVPRVDRPMFATTKSKLRPGLRPADTDAEVGTASWEQIELGRVYAVAYKQYLEAMDMGIAREVARACLPVAIYSACYVTCNPRSLMHFLSLRTHDDRADTPSYPQAEIEEAARKCEAEFARLFPVTYEAFNSYGRVAP